MSVVVVGPLAFDDVRAPAGSREGLLGGSGAYAGVAAAKHGPVALVSICGNDLDDAALLPMTRAGVDLAGLQRIEGRTLRWTGRYSADLPASEVRNTDLGVVTAWDPAIPECARHARPALLADTAPAIHARSLHQPPPDPPTPG